MTLGRTLHRAPAWHQEEPLVSSGTLGQLEAILRAHGPLSADRLAQRLHCRRSTIRAPLDKHPVCFHNGNPAAGFRRSLEALQVDDAPSSP